MNRDIIAFTKYKFNVYGKKDIRSGRDSAVVGIVGKSKSLDFPTMLIFWSLVRNSVVLAVYLLFSVACFLTVHEHYQQANKRLHRPGQKETVLIFHILMKGTYDYRVLDAILAPKEQRQNALLEALKAKIKEVSIK